MITSIENSVSKVDGKLVSVVRISFKNGKRVMVHFDENGKMITKAKGVLK